MLSGKNDSINHFMLLLYSAWVQTLKRAEKVTLSANIKTLETRLTKGEFPSAVDFRFNINATRDPKLRDSWSTIIRNCKTEMTRAMIDDLYRKYNHLKSQIAKEFSELETILHPEQFHEIKRSLEEKSKGMAPVMLQKKDRQYKHQRPKAKGKKPFQRPQKQERRSNKSKEDNMKALFSTLKEILN